MISGLHSCRAGNEPMVGQIKTFTIQPMTGKSGKPYTKIRSASAENGGQPYKILKATPTGHTDSYGNISFNVEIEPANGATPSATAQQPRASNNDDRSSRIERQHSQEMALRYFAVLQNTPDFGMPDTKQLRDMIDWFQRDVGHVPSEPVKQREPEPTTPDTDDEPPF